MRMDNVTSSPLANYSMRSLLQNNARQMRQNWNQSHELRAPSPSRLLPRKTGQGVSARKFADTPGWHRMGLDDIWLDAKKAPARKPVALDHPDRAEPTPFHIQPRPRQNLERSVSPSPPMFVLCYNPSRSSQRHSRLPTVVNVMCR